MTDKKKERKLSWWEILLIILLVIFLLNHFSNDDYKECVEDCYQDSDCTSIYYESINDHCVSPSCYRSLKSCLRWCD